MRPSRPKLLFAVALVIGLAEPYIEIAWTCRAGLESTEACVWGRSLFSLGRWIAPVFVTPVAFVVLLAAAAGVDWVLRRRSRQEPAR